MLSYPERAAQVMEHLVTCPSHGYSQYSRQGDGGTEVVTLTDGSTVTIATGDRDCSSAVCDAWEHALPGSTGGATYTGNMRRGFTSTGLFKWHPWGDGYKPRRGDVYLNESHHTEMYIGGGKLAGFRGSERGTIDGAEGDQTGRESRISSVYMYSKGWDGILAYTGPEVQDEEEEDEMTECLIDVPKCDECPTGATLYYVAGTIHDIDTPDATEVVRKLYRTAHGGREIPVVQLSATKAVPELQRLVGVVRGGIPAERVIDGIDRFAVRSEDRADGNRGVE